jgi:hypothetical protein
MGEYALGTIGTVTTGLALVVVAASVAALSALTVL